MLVVAFVSLDFSAVSANPLTSYWNRDELYLGNGHEKSEHLATVNTYKVEASKIHLTLKALHGDKYPQKNDYHLSKIKSSKSQKASVKSMNVQNNKIVQGQYRNVNDLIDTGTNLMATVKGLDPYYSPRDKDCGNYGAFNYIKDGDDFTESPDDSVTQSSTKSESGQKSEKRKDTHSNHTQNNQKCTSIKLFSRYSSFIDWRLLKRLERSSTNLSSDCDSPPLYKSFLELYSPNSHRIRKLNQIYKILGKPDMHENGPQSMIKFAEKLKPILRESPGLKQYYTRLFHHFQVYFRRQYTMAEIPLRFLLFVHILNEVNYENSLTDDEDSSVTVMADLVDIDHYREYCDLPDIKELPNLCLSNGDNLIQVVKH